MVLAYVTISAKDNTLLNFLEYHIEPPRKMFSNWHFFCSGIRMVEAQDNWVGTSAVCASFLALDTVDDSSVLCPPTLHVVSLASLTILLPFGERSGTAAFAA